MTVEQSNSTGSTSAAAAAAALLKNSTDPIDNEPITWNYNPHAIARSDSKTKPKENGDNSSYNCYSQTLNKLMSEFNVSKRAKRCNNRSGDEPNATKLIDNMHGLENRSPIKTKTRWSDDDRRLDAGDDSHFWSKVLATNNNNSQQNDLLSSTSTLSNVNSTKNSALNIAAGIVNSLNISNHPNNLDMNEVDTINCNLSNDLNKFTSQTSALATTSSGFDLAKTSLNVNSQNLVQKRKQDKPNFYIDKQFEDITSANEVNRMAINSSNLSAVNNSFLQALSDLRLDYNEWGAASRSEHTESTSEAKQSKDRYLRFQAIFFVV